MKPFSCDLLQPFTLFFVLYRAQVHVPRANPHKQTLISWLATVVFALALGGIVSAMGAGPLVGLLLTTALVVVIKSYWVMPFLVRKLSRWLNR